MGGGATLAPPSARRSNVIVARKLGVPFQRELGMGAIGEDGARVINREVSGPGGNLTPRSRRTGLANSRGDRRAAPASNSVARR